MVLVAAELAVRYFSDVSFLGSSRDLFTSNRFGNVRGNTPNVRVISFGEEVFTDSEGFRVPSARYTYPDASARTVLFLGDSVAFGPGVPEEQTFIGLLRKDHPDWTFYNSGVIAYFIQDYKAVLDVVLTRHKHISDVYLVYVLNDVTQISAQDLQSVGEQHKEPRVNDLTQNWVDQVRKVRLISRANEFLSNHSKLYVYLKGHISDPGRRYFFADWQHYRNRQVVSEAIDAIDAIATRLKSANVPFTVVLSPYEFQLRAHHDADDVDVLLPQRVIGKHLRDRGIRYVDALGWFQADGARNGADYFLRFDPMHLSSKGHEVMYRGIRELL